MHKYAKKDKVWGQRPKEYPWIYERIPKESKTILEIGCGISGHGDGRDVLHEVNELTQKLANDGHNITGLDIKELEWKHKNFKFINGDILKNPLDKQKFDIIIASQVMNHVGMWYAVSGILLPQRRAVRKGDERFLDEVHKMLNDDGIAIISTMIGDTHMANTHSREYTIVGLNQKFGRLFTIDEYIEFPRGDGCSRVIYKLRRKNE